MCTVVRLLTMVVVLSLLGACLPEADTSTQQLDVKVDTSSDLAWAQYEQNLRFAESYEARCTVTHATKRPRVLVTGFGRFKTNALNATGLVVSELLDGLDYPMTEPPPSGQVDPPGPQTAVAHGVIELDDIGEVDLCAMVLPVYWDLAAVLVLAEIEAFAPDFVLMNGIAGARQELWLELGAVNRAKATEDGSSILEPLVEGAPLLPDLGEEQYLRGNLASWQRLQTAASDAIADLADTAAADLVLSDVIRGVDLAGYPRASNTYLCNNTTYTVGYLMDHPGEKAKLMQASHPREGFATHIEVSLQRDASQVPRLFMHWPGDLTGEHLSASASVMRSVLAAQLSAEAAGDPPSRGDNSMAELPPMP